MFAFAWLWAFILLPLPWLFRIVFKPAEQSIASALKIPFYGAMYSLIQTRRDLRASWRKWLVFLAWLCFLTALAGPQWIGEPVTIERSGRHIMLAVDLSGSMEIQDMELANQPVDRLTIVKAVADQFIRQRVGDRLGLILFGTRAYLQTPLTFDRQTVAAMLDDATIALAGPQTAIGDAIGLAIKRLQDTEAQDRVLILLTDGANNAGMLDPIQAAEIAARDGIKIYTVGMGADQMVVPSILGPQVVNPSWDLDEAALERIADLTGGLFFRATDSQQLAQVYQAINELEPVVSDEAVFRPITDYYYWPLAVVLFISLYLALRKLRWLKI
ncbi:MAG: VWA domain-containing protein [Gammaproteobacteria bacterium]